MMYPIYSCSPQINKIMIENPMKTQTVGGGSTLYHLMNVQSQDATYLELGLLYCWTIWKVFRHL